MKLAIRCLALFLLLTGLTLPAFAECTPGTFWTSAWTDAYGQTTYSLQAPCKVYIGIPFDLTATVQDNTYPNSSVGFGWAINDNGTALASGGWITLVNGQWQRDLTITYADNPIDHLFQFNFTDLGTGRSAHWWGSGVVGAVTVDPYPPVSNAPVSNAPPTADAGANLFIMSKDQGTTIIQGSAADADGDALSYRWLEGDTELQPSRPVAGSGEAPLDLAALSPLSTGDHTLTLEVSDGSGKATDTMVLSVENSAPLLAPAAGATVNIGEDIHLDGTVADFDGDTLSYQWLEGTTVLGAGQVATARGGAPVSLPETVIPGGLPLGSHVLTLQVSDGINEVAATSNFTVIDTVAPTLAPVPSTSMLWPPNGTMTEVTINTNARDNSGGPVLLNVLLTTNEPQQKGKDGKLVADWSIVKVDQEAKAIVLQLRNGRNGKGGAKVYTVAVTATDASGNASTAEVSITAPHDKRRVPAAKAANSARTK